MRVLMLIYGFYPMVGGAERQCLKLSGALMKRGVDVHVLTFRHSRRWPRREVVDSVPVLRLPRLAPAELNLAPLMAHLFIGRSGYDVIHVHGAGKVAVVAAAWARRWWRKPYLVKCVSSGDGFDLLRAEERKRWPLRAWIRRAVLAANAVVATSRKIEEQLIDSGIGPGRIVSIPNGVRLGDPPDGDLRARRRRELDLPPRACIVLRVGRMGPEKGVQVLLDAWGRVAADHPEAFLLSVGGHPPAEGARRWNEDSCSRVRFVPDQPDGVHAWLEASDIFVLPSFREGLSNALLEAQAAGLPGVVTRVGGNPDVVRDGENGLLVPPGDPEALGQAMGALIRDAGLRERMAACARETARRYDLDGVAGQYESLYRRLVEGERIG